VKEKVFKSIPAGAKNKSFSIQSFSKEEQFILGDEKHPILDSVEDFEDESSNSSTNSHEDNCISCSSNDDFKQTKNRMMFNLGNNQMAKINLDVVKKNQKIIEKLEN
jgi:hypothetical protein